MLVLSSEVPCTGLAVKLRDHYVESVWCCSGNDATGPSSDDPNAAGRAVTVELEGAVNAEGA